MQITQEQYNAIIAKITEDFSKEIKKQCEIIEDPLPKLSDYLTPVFPNPGQIHSPGAIITLVENRDTRKYLELNQHPTVIAGFYEMHHLELKDAINEALSKFDQLLKDKDPSLYRFLPLPGVSSIDAIHFYHKSFPLRGILTFGYLQASWRLMFDTIGSSQKFYL